MKSRLIVVLIALVFVLPVMMMLVPANVAATTDTVTVILRPDGDTGSPANMERYPAPDPAWQEETVDGDAFIAASVPDGNYGTSTALYIGADPAIQYSFYMEFTFSDPGALDAVYLNLYKSYDTSGVTGGIKIYAADTSWDESTLTYNNQPGPDTSYNTTGFIFEVSEPATINAWRNYTCAALTDYVDQANGVVGFYVAYNFTTAGSKGFHSKEAANDPYLSIDIAQVNDAYYYSRLNETTSGGDGATTYCYNYPAGSQSAMYTTFSTATWADYPGITDIDVTPWVIVYSPNSAATREHLWVDSVQQTAWHDAVVPAAYTNYSQFYEVNPQTSAEWTTTSVDGLYVDFGYTPSNDARWTQFGILLSITYTLGPDITNSPVTTGYDGAYYSWGATCTAADSGTNDWTLSTNASWLSLTGEEQTNVTVGGTPDEGAASYWVNVTVEDSDSSDYENYTLTITVYVGGILRPVSDSLAQWQPFPASPTTHYDKVDETTVGGDGVTTYVYTSSAGVYDMVLGLSDLAVENPALGYNVTLWIIARKEAPGPTNVQAGLYLGGYGTAFISVDPAESFTNYSYNYGTYFPRTASDFTFSIINSVSVYLYTNDATPSVRVTQVGVIVEYVDAVDPTADAGPDASCLEYSIVSLDGSGSTDNVGVTNYTWSWQQDSEPYYAYGETPTVYWEFFELGETTVTLNVSDAYGNWDTDTMTMTVNRTNILRPQWDEQLEWFDEYPDDGTHWDKLDEVTSDENTTYVVHDDLADLDTYVDIYGMTNFSYDAGETFNITLWVIALGEGAATCSLTYGLYMDSTQYAASAEVDMETEYTNYSHTWYVSPTDAEEWTGADINDLQVYISEYDGYPAIRVTQMGIHVERFPPDLIDPVADAGPDRTIDRGSFTFDGSGSSDDIGVANWTWTFTYNGSATTIYGEYASFDFVTLGTYTVTLTVYDAFGNSDTDTMTLTVVKPAFQWTDWFGSNLMGFIGFGCLMLLIALPPLAIVWVRGGEGDVRSIGKFIIAWLIALFVLAGALVW